MTRPPGRAYLGHARERSGDGGIVVESGSEDGYVDVLVVDDDEALRTSMVEILSRAGYTVSDAQDGRGALERLASTEVGVMLLDMQMPALDGLGVLLEAPVPRPPVIVVSAHRYDALHQPPGADVFLSSASQCRPRSCSTPCSWHSSGTRPPGPDHPGVGAAPPPPPPGRCHRCGVSTSQTGGAVYPDPRLAQEKVRRLVRRRRLRRRLRTGALVVSGLTAVGSLSFGVVQGIAVVRRVWAIHHRHLTPARRTLSLSTSTTTTAPGPPPCASSQVLAQLSHWQVTSGILYELVVLDETAAGPCTLSGYANLTVSASAGGTLPAPVHDDPNLGGQAGASTAPVVLAAGQPAWFEVSYSVTCASVLGPTQPTSGAPGQCYRGRALGVLLPQATTPLAVVQPLGFSFATSGFSVGPFGSGPPPPSAPVGP